MTADIDYDQRLFSAQADRIDRFAAAIRRIAGDGPRRVLDIGCGTGALINALGRYFPQAELVGVDISAPNIDAANELLGGNRDDQRVSFVAADYLEFRSEPFDLIVSYSTLHLIPGDTDRLLEKVAADLAVNGVFISAMPQECWYNAVLIAVRRIFRFFRGPVTDRLVFRIGRWLTGSATSDAQLRERVVYMYMLPQRLDSPSFRRAATRKGLIFGAEEGEPHASPAQLKHGIVSFRKARA